MNDEKSLLIHIVIALGCALIGQAIYPNNAWRRGALFIGLFLVVIPFMWFLKI